MNIPIIYEDNHLLIVEKPVNVPVQEDSSGDSDLLNVLKKDLKVRYQKPGNVFLGLVHRLDRPVGGVMVFAKTSKAASRLSDCIRKNQFSRNYLAVVRGNPRQNEAILEHFLWKDTKKNQVKTVSASHPEGKKAKLEYKVLDTRQGLSLLRVKLHTGRSHQIRVQLAAEGTPLFGDQKYGQNENRPGQQIALWASDIEFPHPTHKEVVSFNSFPPKKEPWQLWAKNELNLHL